ncbi:MAG: acyl-CoA carboxylase subunit beta [Halobacteriaceae archaeon]
MDDREEELRRRREEVAEGGGEARIEAQHDRGKLTARERIDYFLDDGTFTELDRFRTHRSHSFGMEERKIPGDGVVTGYGDVDGRTVFVFAHDFTVHGGSISEVVAEKICKVMDKATEVGAPIVGLNDSGGARIQEGVKALAGFTEIFHRNQRASGVVPQISAIMGPCAGGAVYSPSITDFVFMVEDTPSYMFLTGPDVIETVTGEEVTANELGGASVHATKTGVAHFSYPDERATLDGIRRLLSYLPQNNVEDPPRVATDDDPARQTDDLGDIVPAEPRKPYDAREVVECVLDRGTFFEVAAGFAKSLVTGFGRLDGRSVGVLANQPRSNAGTLTVDSSMKGSRFVRFCDSFNIPILTFVDVPGYMPGTEQEHRGIIRHGAKLLYAYSEASVPLLTVITRKAYGGAYCVMASKHLGADVNYAWPSAEIAVMGPKGAVNILYSDELSDADDPDALREELIAEYREEFANPYTAADMGYLDDVILPGETRERLVTDLEATVSKREEPPERKHGNIPL